MKILHAGDIHARDKNIEEIERCCEFLVDTARAQRVDLVIIAGDCFDSCDVKLDSWAAKLIIQTVSRLADIAPVAVVVGTPSHDGTAPEILRFARGAHFIHVSCVPEQIYLVGGELSCLPEMGNLKPDAVLSMVPQPTKQYFNLGNIQTSNEAIAHGMAGLFAGLGAQASDYQCPHVLVYHGSIRGAKLSNNQVLTGMDIEVSTDQISLADADLNLCGHIHVPQQLGKNTFYSGSLYPLNWGEDHNHGFYIHEIFEAA